jgi:hypothetical protein
VSAWEGHEPRDLGLGPGAGPARRRAVSTAVGVYVLVLLALQVFLLTVAVDALLADDAGLAWVTAACSVVRAVARWGGDGMNGSDDRRRTARGRRGAPRTAGSPARPLPPTQPTRPGPIGGDMAAILHGIGNRVRLPGLLRRHDHVTVLGFFALINGVVSIALMAAVALITDAPFIFPSLGPTAFLLFYTPMLPTACPRNTLIGHAIGAAAGYLALVVFGLQHAAPAVTAGVSGARIGAAALSLGLTSGAMVWARVPHPPAGATTLIISLGILREPWQLGVLMVAVLLLVLQGLVINRLAGVPYPLWGPVREPPAIVDPARSS